MKLELIRKLNEVELQNTLRVHRETLGRLRYQHSYSSVGDPMEIRNTRRTLARILTTINERRKEREGKRR
jgi:large subunit ribosomal protein L29